MKNTFKNYLYMFLTWLKIGLFTFGGGYAMIALIQNEISEKKSWISSEELTKIIAIAESTPGPIAINSATYIGYKMLGFWGAFVATLGTVLPSFTIIFIISLFFNDLLKYEVVANAFLGIKAGVSALIFLAGIKILKTTKEKNVLFFLLFGTIFVATTLVGIFSWNFSSLYFILIGAVVGLFVAIINKSNKNNDNSNNDKHPLPLTDTTPLNDTNTDNNAKGGKNGNLS